MREIKFRGKRKDNNEWVSGCLIIEEPPLQCFASEQKEDNKYLIGKSGFADWNMQRPFTAAEVYPDSVGQYTGLKDRKGDEIWEGDILKSKPYLFDGTYILGKVFWDSVRAMWRVEEISYKFQFNPDTEYLNEVLKPPHDTEIIGNVFDNPELLNK